jgi:hypothetical protein
MPTLRTHASVYTEINSLFELSAEIDFFFNFVKASFSYIKGFNLLNTMKNATIYFTSF